MGRLWYPFVAASAALVIAGIVVGPVIFWRFRSEEQILWGAVIGVLACIVLYAVMRAIAARPTS